ncbi:MAG: family 10 glycosylhydrolase [Caldithrix sp.]|nr:family 10 glycosylhydrolase [Caldithrix sp.]
MALLINHKQFLNILIALIIMTGYQFSDARNKELRGVWMTNVASSVMFSKPSIAEAMDSLKAWGINAVFPVIYNNGYTLYPSLVMQSITGNKVHPMFEGRDVLQELVTEGHRNGIEVHPWIEYGFVASFGQNGGPILANNPDWAGKRYDMDTAESDDQFYWMSQANPEVQQFLIALGIEIVQNYDVDGVQLDRIRYGNTLDNQGNVITSDFGYDDAHVQRYKDEHDDADPPLPTDSGYKSWRAGILNEFHLNFYEAIKAENPNVMVSNAPVVYPYGYNNFMQRWMDWLEQGSVDFVSTQLYRYDVSSYEYELNKVLYQQIPDYTDQFFPGMLIRSGNYQVDYDLASGFVNKNRQKGVDGGVFWFYEGLPAIGRSIGDGIYKTPAKPGLHDIVWREDGLIVHEDNDSLTHVNGTWETLQGEGADSYYSFDQRLFTAIGGSGASITFDADIPYAGYFDVYVYQPYDNDLAQSVPVTLLDGSGITKSIDESSAISRGWVFIETIYF